MSFFKDNSYSIGHTPLVSLKNILGVKNDGFILGKVEARNPAYSVKCRIGSSMIWDAEKKGLLGNGQTIIEPTSGNTGIALSMVGAAKGYKVKLVMPDTMSIERRRVLKAMGADLVLSKGEQGMKGAVNLAEEIVAENPKDYHMPQQFKNPSNPMIHEKTTGPEINQDTDGQIEVFVSGVGTGGTITGVSRYFKKHLNKKIISVAVEPKDSPVLSQKLSNQDLKPGPHKIQGIGAGFIPDILELDLIDEVVQVENDEAFEWSRQCAKKGGVLVGISSGAAVAAVYKLLQKEEYKNKNIVVILPDGGERYLSTTLFD